MDSLDRLAAPAADLLDRVDELLANVGAPADHRIWPLLRQLRVLPGDAVGAITTLRPAPLAAAGDTVRELIREYAEVRAVLTGEVDWQGAGAEAFSAARESLAEHIDGVGESLTGRLNATAGYADALADWVGRTRLELAGTLVGVLGSAEAVTVVAEGAGGGSGPGARAAAEIGARVLATVATAYDEAESLPHRWSAAHAELPYRAPSGGGAGWGAGWGGATRIAL